MYSLRPEICRRYATMQRNIDLAVQGMVATVGDDAQLTIVFVSPDYDLATLARKLRETFSGPLIGCTTAGEIGPDGFQRGGIVAMSLTSPLIRAHTWSFGLTGGGELERVSAEIDARLQHLPSDENAVGIMLIDGLSGREEYASAALYAHLGNLPIVGGSAGDNLAFGVTAVLDGSEFKSDRATITLLHTTLPLTTFKFQHHQPTATRMVVTAALPERRIIQEIDGYPAVEAYAAALGLSAAELVAHPELICRHPLMLRVGDEHFVRSVRQLDDNGWLHLYCAIDRGAVLTLGVTESIVAGLRDHLEALHREGPIEALVVFDCILRRLEMEADQIADTAGALLSGAGAVGFSTYGEQFGALHVNQTMVGFALGAPRDD